MLDNKALKIAVEYFKDYGVAAVGGSLKVMKESGKLLEKLQSYEYISTFQVIRRIFASINGQCLISGAFGLFRKHSLIEVGCYDTDAVGEDMELDLRLQNGCIKRSKRKVIYEPKAVSYTGAPQTFKRLVWQRDCWQRGLLDCIIKHFNMMFNPFLIF